MHLPVLSRAARHLSALLLSALVVLLALPGYAQTEVPRDWPLKPAGLVAGDEFRLLFMGQNGLEATSTAIADYDAFVQEIITRRGHADIVAYAAHFKVLGSTATVNARTHTGTAGTGGVPIHWLNGPRVADDYADFYDGSWSNRDAARLQDGVRISQNRRDQFLCTGTNDDGTTAQPLGANPCTATTFDTTTNTLSGKTLATSEKARYLVLSDVFRVEGNTDLPVPVVEGVAITSDPGSDREYVAGDAIEATVTFSESVTVTGTPRLKLMLGTQVWADHVAAESTATELVFSYTVSSADYAHAGVSLPADGLDLNGGTIESQAGTVDANLEYVGKGEQGRHRVYVRPAVSGVAVVSTPLAHGIYLPGEAIEIDLTWDKKVAVFGTPLLQVFMEGPVRLASYTMLIGDHVTRFEYEVQAGDTDSNGILLMNNGVRWNGGAIIRQGHGDHANKSSLRPMLNGGATSLPTQRGHRVNVSPSTDATLDLLVLADGSGNEIVPSPAFDPATTSYAASVAAGVDRISIEAVAEGFPYATLEYLDDGDNVLADADTNELNFQVPLAEGANTVKLKVTADDEVTTETYAVEVARAAAVPNNEATGKPAVTGTAQEGRTLTAAKGTIADADGLTRADDGDAGYAYAYRWVRVDGSSNETDIGTSSSTYTLVAADVGHTVRVEVSFKDDAGHAEGPLASDATASVTAVPNNEATGKPAVTGTAQEGRTLTAAKGTIADADGLTRADDGDAGYAYAYRWVRVDGSSNETDIGTSSSTYTLVAADVGHTVRVEVSFKDDAGHAEGPLASDATASVTAVPNNEATGKPTVTGTAQEGRTLTAGLGTIVDADGVPSTVDYQWVRVDADGSSNPAEIGTNSSTYTPVAADVGKKIRVEVSFTDDRGTAEGPLASDAVPKTGTVVTANSVACPADSDWCTEITLSYTSSAVTDAIRSERWGFGSDSTPGAIDDATFTHGGTAYTIRGLELYRFTVTGSGASDLLTLKTRSVDLPDGTVLTLEGTEFTIDEQSHRQTPGEEQWSFDPPGLAFDWTQNQKVTASLKLPPAGAATGKPAITGAPQLGETLMASVDDIMDTDGVPGTVAYQWVRVDADGSSNPTNIGTNSSTYAPVAADVGKRIRVEVSFTDDGGNAEGPLASNAVPEAGTVVPAKAACPADADWCTEMTLYYTAAHQPHFYERWGYTSISTPSGAIDDNTYSHGGTEYTIERLGLNRDHLNSGSNDLLTFDLTYEPVSGELPDGTVLTLDGVEFTVGIVSDTLETGKEQWSPKSMGISLNWVKGQKVTVSLTFPSADATLTTLALTDGDGNAIALAPIFVSETATYTASVGNDVKQVSVAPELSVTGATVAYLDGSNSAIADADTIAPGQQVALAVGPNTIKVKVTAADTVATRIYELTVARAPGSAAATGKPAISGTAQVGQTLTAAIGTIADEDGLPSTFPDDYTFQWVRVDADDTNPEDIADATGHAYTLVAADEGKKIKVKAFFTDESDTPEGPLESEATATVGAVSVDAALSGLALEDEHGSAITLAPTFASDRTSYTASVGNAVDEITVTPGLADDGATVAYLDGSDSAIADADTIATGQQVALAVGPNTIKVKVTAGDGATQTYTVVVSRSGGKPAIVGTAQVGHTLIAAKGEIDDPDGTTKADNGDAGYAYTYQWVRVDADGTSDPHDIGSATSNAYTLVAADEGKKVRVKLSFKDDAGDVEERTSDAYPGSGTIAAGGGGLIATLVEREPVEGTGGRLHYVFDLHLSAGVSKSYRDVRDHVFTVTGGSTVGARRIHRDNQPRPGTNQLALVSNHWRVEVRPSTDHGEVTVAMTANRACDQDGALCALDGGTLSHAPSLILASYYPTLSIADASADEDDGELRFTITLSRPSPRYDVHYDVETVAGGSATEGVDYTAQPKVTNRIQSGAVTQEFVVPLIDDAVDDDGETFTVRIGNARLEDAGGTRRTLAITRAEATGTIGSVEATPQPVPDALTASFENVPSEHNGYTPFKLRLAFSAPVVTSPAVLRDQALSATGGAVTAVRRVNGRGDLWEITVDQSGSRPVTVRLAASAPCDQPGAVCTSDGRALSNAPSATVPGKPALSVADAEVAEAPGAMLVFAVTLDRPPTAPVTVNWKTLDRTATAGQDYTEASGSLAFDLGEKAAHSTNMLILSNIIADVKVSDCFCYLFDGKTLSAFGTRVGTGDLRPPGVGGSGAH